MSFVGTRPEAVKYVEKYKPEYMATLLLPAGITSEASIRYKDEAEARYVKALCLTRFDEDDEAKKILDNLLEENADNAARYYYALGRIQKKQGNAAGIIGYNRCENIEYSKV